MKEIYESMKLLLGKIKYDEFKWKLYHVMIVALLFRMQLGTQNPAISCASEKGRTRRIAMQINCGLNEHH
jgi:hypothetical protein